MFNEKGVIVLEREGLDEDTVMSDALEAGGSDFQADEDVFEIYTEPSDFSGVRDDLEAKGYSFVSAEVEMVPDTYTDLTDPDQILKMQKLIDALEDNDDVQQVWHNWNRRGKTKIDAETSPSLPGRFLQPVFTCATYKTQHTAHIRKEGIDKMNELRHLVDPLDLSRGDPRLLELRTALQTTASHSPTSVKVRSLPRSFTSRVPARV